MRPSGKKAAHTRYDGEKTEESERGAESKAGLAAASFDPNSRFHPFPLWLLTFLVHLFSSNRAIYILHTAFQNLLIHQLLEPRAWAPAAIARATAPARMHLPLAFELATSETAHALLIVRDELNC